MTIPCSSNQSGRGYGWALDICAVLQGALNEPTYRPHAVVPITTGVNLDLGNRVVLNHSHIDPMSRGISKPPFAPKLLERNNPPIT